MSKDEKSKIEAEGNPKKGSVVTRWGKGLFAQQAAMAYPPHLAEFNREVLAAYKGFFSLRIVPGKVESFENAVIKHIINDEFLKGLNIARLPGEDFDAAFERLGVKKEVITKRCDQILQAKCETLKNLQIAMYCLAIAIFMYSAYLAISGSFFGTLGTFLWACGITARGYLYGFRAWQIQHRALIRLQDALKIKSTYLVL